MEPKTIVISQPMFFAWVGMLEQIKLCDEYVFYNDVQFSKGSFVNRVQLKLPEGSRWMTVPIQKFSLGQRIIELQPHTGIEWQSQHLDQLSRSFAKSPFRDDALGLVEKVYDKQHSNIGDLSRASTIALADYFGLVAGRRFIDVSELAISGSGTDRVLAVVKRLGGKIYVTGHGATQYLNHEKFDDEQISVKYMNYQHAPYAQQNGPFNPFVSGLDLVANCGREGINVLVSKAIPWRKFLDESK